MVNLLLEGFDIDAPWLRATLADYLRPEHRVVILPFAFRDDRIASPADWNAVYGRGGRYYAGLIGGFAAYGIPEEQITIVNYFTDTPESAAQAIESADVVYFLGGLPDRMMERIRAFGLVDVLMRHDGIVMGYSAGALIQLAEYHLSPDADYPAFGYYKGLPCLQDFYLEVHYEGTQVQDASIRRVLAERAKPVYATAFRAGAILVDNGRVKLLGDVRTFPAESAN